VNPLLNISMKDGSRHFLSLLESFPWEPFRDHFAMLPNAAITNFVTDHITEVWIDFSYEGHAFTINNQFGEFWFLVSDPNCPNTILEKVASHGAAFYKA